MPSFGSATFLERGDGTTYPAKNREQQIEVRHVPGSNTNVIQDGGRAAEQITLPVYLTSSELAALYSAVGTSATLTYSYETRSAYLKSVADAREIRAKGVYFATLNLIGR